MNKQDYEKMSDFEINKAVAHKIYKSIGGQDYTQHLTVKHSAEEGGDCIYYCGGEPLDYCNNWSDMGPLIEQNQINLNYFCDEECSYYSCSSGENGLETDCDFVDNKNPLRAAAIVYLLVKDNKK